MPPLTRVTKETRIKSLSMAERSITCVPVDMQGREECSLLDLRFNRLVLTNTNNWYDDQLERVIEFIMIGHCEMFVVFLLMVVILCLR